MASSGRAAASWTPGELGKAPAELRRLELLGQGGVLGVAGGEALDDLQPGAGVPHLELQLGAALQQGAIAGLPVGELLDRRQLGGAVAARHRQLAGRLQGDRLRRTPALEELELLAGLVELLGAHGLVQPVRDDLHGAGVELAGALQGERAARGDGAVGRVGEGDVAQPLGGAAEQQLARRVGGHRVADRQQALDHAGVLAGGEVDLGGEDLGRRQPRLALQHLRRRPGRPGGVAGVEETPPGTLQPLAELRIDRRRRRGVPLPGDRSGRGGRPAPPPGAGEPAGQAPGPAVAAAPRCRPGPPPAERRGSRPRRSGAREGAGAQGAGGAAVIVAMACL